MQISGTGITTFTAKIKPDFKPDTKYALYWSQASDGTWHATDRGTGADRYDCNIRIYGKESDLMNFVHQIEYNRIAGSNVIHLSSFTTGEHIFGADIDYSSGLDVVAFMERGAQITWKGFEQPLSLCCKSPTFVGGVGYLPALRYTDIGYDGDSDRTINKIESYNRTFYYQDHVADYGTFTGIFTFTDEEMKSLRRFIAKQRGAEITINQFYGIDNPFGYRGATFPLLVKIISFEDLGMVNFTCGNPRWKAKLTFVEGVENLAL